MLASGSWMKGVGEIQALTSASLLDEQQLLRCNQYHHHQHHHHHHHLLLEYLHLGSAAGFEESDDRITTLEPRSTMQGGGGCTCLTVFKSAVSAGGMSSGCCLPTAAFFTFFPLLPAAGNSGLCATAGATLHGDKSVGFLNPADCTSRP
jgi:hypothetical protein